MPVPSPKWATKGPPLEIQVPAPTVGRCASCFGLAGFAHAYPTGQEFLTPSFRKFVVSPIPNLTEPKLMNSLETLPHLEFSEMLSTESIDVIQPTPNVAVFFGFLRGQVRGGPWFKASKLHHVSRAGGNYGWRGDFSGVAEGEYGINRPLLAKMSLGFDCHVIGRGLARILEDQVYRPMLVISILGFRPPEHSCFHHHISAQLPFGGMTRIANLRDNPKNEAEGRDSEETGQYGERIVERFLQHPREITLVSTLIGMFCTAIGITLYLNGRGTFTSIAGLLLLGIGMITPLFPWWALLLVVVS
jgi:hypothetical protein